MQLFHKKYGESGKVIFILHGIFGMLDNWHNIAKQLSADYTVYTIDARNHGQSPNANDSGYQAMAEDVIELADSLNINKFILLGHSMGGKTAMWTAHQYADRVEKLVVVDIAPKSYKPGHNRYFDAFAQIDWSSMETRKDIDEALAVYEDNAGVRLFLAKNIERGDDGRFSVKSNIPAIRNSYNEIIGKLDFNRQYEGETLFITGYDSKYLSETDKPEIEKYFPNSSYAVVTKAGHWVHADNPAEFLEKLKNFL